MSIPYLSGVEKLPQSHDKFFKHLPPPIKSSFMNIFDIYKAKGEAEGLQQGLQQGKDEKNHQACANIIKLGFGPEVICKVLEVTPAFVEVVRREVEKENTEE